MYNISIRIYINIHSRPSYVNVNLHTRMYVYVFRHLIKNKNLDYNRV